MAPVVIGLDLSTTAGWCAGPVGGIPKWGAWRLAEASAERGARWGGLSNQLSALIVASEPALVVKEAPLRFAAQSSEMVRRSQYGLHAAAEEACWRLGIEPREVDADKVRMALMGRCRWPKGPDGARVDPKKMVLAWCRDHGFDVRQPDAADALMVWLYACEHFAALSGRPGGGARSA